MQTAVVKNMHWKVSQLARPTHEANMTSNQVEDSNTDARQDTKAVICAIQILRTPTSQQWLNDANLRGKVENMTLVYTNADTLANKMWEVQMIAIERKSDIIGITEVSPKYTKEVLSKQQLTLDGYDLYINIEEEEVARSVAVYNAKHLALRGHEIKIDTVCF